MLKFELKQMHKQSIKIYYGGKISSSYIAQIIFKLVVIYCRELIPYFRKVKMPMLGTHNAHKKLLKFDVVQTDEHSIKILLRPKNLKFLRRTNHNTKPLYVIKKLNYKKEIIDVNKNIFR